MNIFIPRIRNKCLAGFDLASVWLVDVDNDIDLDLSFGFEKP
jgi:hypothetical protein